MSAEEFASDRKKVDANYNEMSEFGQIDHLGLLRKTSRDFATDPESISICPLLTPSPTGGHYPNPGGPLSQTMEENMLLGEKSPSPDFNQDEETALLAASSPLASYGNSLDPLRSLAFDCQAASSDGTEILFDAAHPNLLAGNLPETFHHRGRNSFPSVELESSTSSGSIVLTENISSAKLLSNHYQHLDESKLSDVAKFIGQDNGKRASLDLSCRKPPPDYSFVSWNWPLIRKSCFWTVVSSTIACLCVIVAVLASVPKRCQPPHSWYHGTVFYEIFPASYQDSDGDGVGDFRGIASRADYISKLGIRAVRLNSIFPAVHYPEGFGKITNLTAVEKSLGDFRDFRYFVRAMNERNISVVLDFPVYPFVKSLGETKTFARRKQNMVEEPLTNVFRPIRSAENESFQISSESRKAEILGRKRYLKTYIDGGIAGLMKSTSGHHESASKSTIEDAIRFWFENGVDGIYLKGLERYANDWKFPRELEKWKKIKENYRHLGMDKMLMCESKVLDFVGDEETVRSILTTMDLLDVYLDLSNGTSHIKAEVSKYHQNRIADKSNPPWIHWNVGNVGTKRLAGRVENNLGAILFEFLLPGTISIFYGDEIGLTEIHDPHLDHKDVEHVHHLAPMKWQPNGTGFTRPDALPWLPFAKSVRTNRIHEEILSNMSHLRSHAPGIYMNSIRKEQESLSNAVFRFADDNIVVLERSYPRRNAYAVVYNAGTDEARNDLSNIYHRGEILEDSRGRNGIYTNFDDLKLESGEAFVVKLDK